MFGLQWDKSKSKLSRSSTLAELPRCSTLAVIGEDEVHDDGAPAAREEESTRSRMRRISHGRMLEAMQRGNTVLGVDADQEGEEEARQQEEQAKKRSRAARARARRKQNKEKRRLARRQSRLDGGEG